MGCLSCMGLTSESCIYDGTSDATTMHVSSVKWCQVVRFCSDPNQPGTEKLAICRPFQNKPGDQRLWSLESADVGGQPDWAPPMCVFNIKGWTRSLAATVILRSAYENPEVLKVPPCNPSCSFCLLSVPGSTQDGHRV